MARPNLRRIRYSDNHERRVLQVLTIALRTLSTESPLPRSENAINRRLYFHIHRAIRQLFEEGVELGSVPIYEAYNQPDASDQDRAAREDKRPDFQFVYVDHLEPNPDEGGKQYVVECKRIGTSGTDWRLNVNYIINGVLRFCTQDHGYAKSQPSAAMIGFIQAMEPELVLSEVNTIAAEYGIPELERTTGRFNQRDVTRLIHRLKRDVPPSPFDLRHLWLNLSEHAFEG